jgi:nitrate/nitrite-specific signal transduction histidine kinase
MAWKGIAEIDISIPANLLENQGRNLLLVQFVEEAIANAVRHANADRISVRAQLLPNQQVSFSIINNGITEGQDSVGMGTAWLNHHAPNSWSRRQTENGIELTITL